MPLCALHLLSLHNNRADPLVSFLDVLDQCDTTPLVVSRILRWIILPRSLSTEILLAQNIRWDVMLVLPNTAPLPDELVKLVRHNWTITVGIPKALLQDFHRKNRELLSSATSSDSPTVNELKNAHQAQDSQNLELSAELQSWIRSFSSSGSAEGQGAVSMLNLLSFKPKMKPSYLQYGKAFAESVGSKRGGNAKLVGNVVDVNEERSLSNNGAWDEFALAHYPSILHFADMLASKDYQDVNHRFRIPALADTFILCTSEIGVDKLLRKKKEIGRL